MKRTRAKDTKGENIIIIRRTERKGTEARTPKGEALVVVSVAAARQLVRKTDRQTNGHIELVDRNTYMDRHIQIDRHRQTYIGR